jgi:hypothetical protein
MRLSDVSVCGQKAAAVLAVAFSLCLDVSAQLLDAFEHGDFESSLSHGRRGKYAEVARGFGRNGNGGARLSGFVRHSFALPVKETLVLRRGERYIFSLDVCNHGKRDIIEQIAFEVYDAKTGRYDHGYWGRTVKDLGDGWHREELAFVPKRDLKDSAESLRFILFVQLDPHRKPAIPVGLPENKIDCDNAVLRRDAPIWSFHNTWPTHNRIDPVEGRVRGYSSFVGPFVSSNAALRYEMVLRDGKARRLCAVTAREEAGVLEAAFGPIRHQGPAQLAVRLFADNVFVAERTRAVTVAQPPVLRPTDVEIDDRGRTLVGGRPFMPIGFY